MGERMTHTELDAAEALANAATEFPGYEVSADGTVWSVGSNWRGRGKRALVPIEAGGGYMKVRLSVDGVRINRAVHRLVAAAFLPPRPPGAELRHLDGDKRNNAATNLAWGTPLENARDRDAHGTTARGSRMGTARLTEDQVREIRQLGRSETNQYEIAARFGVHQATVSRILLRKGWKHVD